MGFFAFLGLIGVLWLLYVIAKNTGDSRDRQQEILLTLKQLQAQISEQKDSPEPRVVLGHEKTTQLEAGSPAVVNINQADMRELQALPGVGKALAQKIIDRRPFQRIDEMSEVPGISEELLEKLRVQVCL